MTLLNETEEANVLCTSMHDIGVKSFLRNVLMYSAKLPMEELSAVSATEILLVKKREQYRTQEACLLLKSFALKSKKHQKASFCNRWNQNLL